MSEQERLKKLVDAAIVWTYCPSAGSYTDGRSVEDCCEELAAAVSAYTGYQHDDDWWSEEDMRSALASLPDSAGEAGPDPYATYGKRGECDKPALKGRAAIVEAWNDLPEEIRQCPDLAKLWDALGDCEDAAHPAPHPVGSAAVHDAFVAGVAWKMANPDADLSEMTGAAHWWSEKAAAPAPADETGCPACVTCGAPALPEAIGGEAAKYFEKYVALAEKCGAEVGRHDGQMAWMKFHSQSSVENFATGIAMLTAVKSFHSKEATPEAVKGYHPGVSGEAVGCAWPHCICGRDECEGRAAPSHPPATPAVAVQAEPLQEFYCNKCGYVGPVQYPHNRPCSNSECNYMASPLAHPKPAAPATADDAVSEREMFDATNIRDVFGNPPTHRERELMFKAWEARALRSGSIVGLGKRDVVTPNVDQHISVPAPDAQEKAPGLVNLGRDGAEHHLQPAGSALPHAGDGTPATAEEAVSEPTPAQIELLARYLCARDDLNPDQVLDYGPPAKLIWHREDLRAKKVLRDILALRSGASAQPADTARLDWLDARSANGTIRMDDALGLAPQYIHWGASAIIRLRAAIDAARAKEQPHDR